MPPPNKSPEPGHSGLSRDPNLLAQADRLNAADLQIDATFARRTASPAAERAWREATDEGHRARERMYPESFWRDARALANGDTNAIEPALIFLETDPWCFRSGYVKADLMRYLSRIPLTGSQERRIERILLHLVDVGDRREFGYACRLARAIHRETLISALKARLKSEDRSQVRRALQMLVSVPNPPFDGDELRAARNLVREEGLTQWAALGRDTERMSPDWDLDAEIPQEHNRQLHRWVGRVAPRLGLDRYSLELNGRHAGT